VRSFSKRLPSVEDAGWNKWFGSATPKVRHSEGPALLCNLLSLGSKLIAQINGTYLTLSLTLTITLTLLTLTVTVRVTLRNGGPSEWRTVTEQITTDAGLSLPDAWSAVTDRSAWRALRPTVGQAYDRESTVRDIRGRKGAHFPYSP